MCGHYLQATVSQLVPSPAVEFAVKWVPGGHNAILGIIQFPQ